ncbi:MAG: hypothetical protein KF886_00285 [Candidatus Hydrogenedentes bacterium]|nr:hypothetical protein [Candidatus Hydrogenedentota bacterium]
MSDAFPEARGQFEGHAIRDRAARQRRMLPWRAHRMAFWILYDYAGGLIALNIVTLAAVLLPVWLAARALPGAPALPAALAVALAALAAAGHASLAVSLVAGEPFSARLVWRGARRLAAGALVMAALFGAAMATAAIGIWFYTYELAPRHPVAGLLAAGVCWGAGALVAMVAVYAPPALVHEKGAPLRAVRGSFRLVARHPVLSAAGLLTGLANAALMLTPPGLLLFSGLPALVSGCCAYELAARADALDAAIASGAEIPPGALDEDDLYLNRGICDLLFPWKV